MLTYEFNIPLKTRKECTDNLLKHFPSNKVKRIEKGIYDFTEQYCKNNNYFYTIANSIYREKYQNIMFNLDQNSKTIKTIKAKIIKKNVQNADYNLAFLTPIELNEDQWKAILIRKKRSEELLNNLPTVPWRPCYICKMNKYYFYQLQTRSADEATTTFYICSNCDKCYKINK